jgi:hypothetical protein
MNLTGSIINRWPLGPTASAIAEPANRAAFVNQPLGKSLLRLPSVQRGTTRQLPTQRAIQTGLYPTAKRICTAPYMIRHRRTTRAFTISAAGRAP